MNTKTKPNARILTTRSTSMAVGALPSLLSVKPGEGRLTSAPSTSLVVLAGNSMSLVLESA